MDLEFIKKNRKKIKEILQIDDLEKRVEEIEKKVGTIHNIKDAFCFSGEESLQEEIKRLQAELIKEKEEKSRLEKECQKLEFQNRELLYKLEKIVEEYNSSPLKRLKELYDSLSDITKDGLKNIFKSDDELVLFASGIREISAIWDYAAYLRREHKDEEFKKVREMFYILFDVYKKIANAAYQDVRIGDIFDFKYHIRDNRSKSMSGRIEEVVFYGYVENGIIIKKSIVKVR